MSVDVESEILAREWFYEFELPSGAKTSTYIDESIAHIHRSRLELLCDVLDPHFEGRWGQIDCLDLACHESYYASHLARRGCRRVVGADIRPDHLAHSALIRDVYGLDNLEFVECDAQTVDAEALGTFDAVVIFGLMYHLENPMRVLRLAAATTSDVCLIETQVAPHLGGRMDWGSYRWTKDIMGCFALIDEATAAGADRPEASVSSVSLVPSLDGLLWLLNAVGFARVEVLAPHPDHYEQLVSGKRVVVAAYK